MFELRGRRRREDQISIGLARLRLLDIVNRLFQDIPQVDLQDGGHPQKRIQSRIPRGFVPNGIGGSGFKRADEGLAQARL